MRLQNAGRKGAVKMAKCRICGKTVGSFSVAINPRDDVPEIKRTVRLCSRRCANVFIGRIKASRTRKSNLNERRMLEAVDRNPSRDEIARAFLTLTSGEKRNLALLGMTAILQDTQSLKGFYEFLSGWKK